MRELERREADTRPTVTRSTAELRRLLAPAHESGRRVGLVPTMGSFHEGHLSLMRAARKQCELVVVSLFVNPTQFGAGEDLESYPRNEPRDVELAASIGVDIVFAPGLHDMYPPGFSTSVEVRGLTDVLCGAPASRGASHFRGVTTVVSKLFNICRPSVAYFGQKDYQQALVIRRMVRDLDIPVELVICPTVRESDGLAMSSRNAYLSEEDRRRAPALKRALDTAAEAAAAGGDISTIRDAALAELHAFEIQPEYVEVVDADDLSPIDRVTGQRVAVVIAAEIGEARLIDNVLIDATNIARANVGGNPARQASVTAALV